MDSIGINLKDELRDYSKFFLTRNPFPSLTVPDDTPSLTADREEPIRRFKDSVIELTKNNLTSISVVVGEYGSGKSHLFRVFKQEVNRQLLSTHDGTLATIIKSPGNDFSDLFFAFIDDIGKNLLTKHSAKILNEYIAKNKQSVKDFIRNADMREQFEHKSMSLEDFLQNSTFINLNKKIRKDLLSEIKNDDLVYAFLSLPHPEFGTKAWKWFLGSNLDKSEMTSINVANIIKGSSLAYDLFIDIVKLLKFAGIKSLVIFVDELEKITFLTRTPRTQYQDDLRHWLDSYPNNVCFYFAIAPHQWDILVKEPTALVRRLSGNWYILKPFEKEDSQELIEKYLDWGRIDNYQAKNAKKDFPNCEPSLCPFTNASLSTIQSKSKGNVSNILLLCRRCLEYLYDDFQKYKAITPELVNYVTEREGFG